MLIRELGFFDQKRITLCKLCLIPLTKAFFFGNFKRKLVMWNINYLLVNRHIDIFNLSFNVERLSIHMCTNWAFLCRNRKWCLVDLHKYLFFIYFILFYFFFVFVSKTFKRISAQINALTSTHHIYSTNRNLFVPFFKWFVVVQSSSLSVSIIGSLSIFNFRIRIGHQIVMKRYIVYFIRKEACRSFNFIIDNQ